MLCVVSALLPFPFLSLLCFLSHLLFSLSLLFSSFPSSLQALYDACLKDDPAAALALLNSGKVTSAMLNYANEVSQSCPYAPPHAHAHIAVLCYVGMDIHMRPRDTTTQHNTQQSRVEARHVDAYRCVHVHV